MISILHCREKSLSTSFFCFFYFVLFFFIFLFIYLFCFIFFYLFIYFILFFYIFIFLYFYFFIFLFFYIFIFLYAYYKQMLGQIICFGFRTLLFQYKRLTGSGSNLSQNPHLLFYCRQNPL